MSTVDSVINLLPTDLGATVYIEIIIVELFVGITPVSINTECDRTCGVFSSIKLLRDLYPVLPTKTVKMMLNAKGRKTVDFVPYYRDYNTNTISVANYSDVVTARKSVVYMYVGLSEGQVRFAMEHIGTHREILPSRMPK